MPVYGGRDFQVIGYINPDMFALMEKTWGTVR